MTTHSSTPDRGHDLSQPLDKLSVDENLKASSDQLRGTIAEGLLDEITGGLPSAEDQKLLKFHGLYQQDDRDLRDERRRQKLEPAYHFLIRLRLPGGVCTSDQWLKIDELARRHGRETLQLTTRQTFQFHWVLKRDLKETIQELHSVLLDTVAACGDDARGVMCSVNPSLFAVHAEVYAFAKRTSDHVIPKMRAYHEIWYGEQRVATSETEEPFYGRTYLPRKFKIGFAIPPINDIDVFTQDLGFIAVAGKSGLEGFNVAIGGGMGRADRAPKTYPRLADVIGFVPKDRVLSTAVAVMSVQRDYGNRVDRAHARFKYTIDDRGLDWVTGEIEKCLGWPLEAPRPFEFTSNGDVFGWLRGQDGSHHYTLFIENGRITNDSSLSLLDGLREIAGIHHGTFRLTPNQNLIIADIAPRARRKIEAALESTGFAANNQKSPLRLNSMACVSFPTCGLAMAESERYLPSLIGKIESIFARHGLSEEPITIRMSGCPNGCSRPYVAEIGLSGRAPGKYNLYLGGGFHGQRLNKMYRENIGDSAILEAIEEVAGRYANEKKEGERFGDFAIRAGFVQAVPTGRSFND